MVTWMLPQRPLTLLSPPSPSQSMVGLSLLTPLSFPPQPSLQSMRRCQPQNRQPSRRLNWQLTLSMVLWVGANGAIPNPQYGSSQGLDIHVQYCHKMSQGVLNTWDVLDSPQYISRIAMDCVMGCPMSPI